MELLWSTLATIFWLAVVFAVYKFLFGPEDRFRRWF